MENKVLKTLRGKASFSLGMVESVDILYTQPTEKGGKTNSIPNMVINRYWLEQDFDLDRLVLSFCMGSNNGDELDIVYFFNVLVQDMVNMLKGNPVKLAHNSVEVTYERVLKALGVSSEDLSLVDYLTFLKDMLDNFKAVAELGFDELSKKAKENFEGLEENNLTVTVNVINNLTRNLPLFDGVVMPSITLKQVYGVEQGDILECICLDTKFVPVPLVHLLEFKDNYIELGSIIATKWVNDCVNIYSSEDALLTTREAVFYVSCILVGMFVSLKNGLINKGL